MSSRARSLARAACAAPPPKPASGKTHPEDCNRRVDRPGVRLVTLRGEDGGEFTIIVVRVVGISQVKVGDKLVVSYYEGLAAEVKKPGEGAKGVETEVRARSVAARRKTRRRRGCHVAHDRYDRIRRYVVQYRELQAVGRPIADRCVESPEGQKFIKGLEERRPGGDRVHRGPCDGSETRDLSRIAGAP